MARRGRPRKLGGVQRGLIRFGVWMRPGPYELARMFPEAAKDLLDQTESFHALLPIVIAEERAIFAARGLPIKYYWGKAAVPWRNLTGHYLRYRPAGADTGSPIARNVLTGALMSKLLSPSAGVITSKSLSFGERDLPYSRALQFGWNKRKQPPRPFLGPTPGILEAARGLFAAHYDRVLSRLATSMRFAPREKVA